MDYEKLHKDTIAKLQEMVNSGKITVETACGICADFVPESDDEVMIKFIRNQLFNIKKTITENYELDTKLTKAMDWLERQGKQETDEWKEGSVIRYGGTLALVIKGRKAIKSNGELFTIQYPNEWVKAAPNEIEHFLNEFEKQGEQNPNTDFSDIRTWKYIVDAVLTEKEGIGQYLDSPFTEEVANKLQKRFGNIEQILANSAKTCKGEQKPTELPKGEDYGIDGLYAAIDILTKTLGEVDGYQSDDGILEHKCAISAVKELSKQQKPWSEEDKKMSRFIGNAITADGASEHLESKGIQVIDAHVWLDGLKERVQPQITWKPSDEQVNALESAVSLLQSTTLESLYNELKKLMEE